MPPSFDLTAEPWVPLHMLDGQVREVSLREAFALAGHARAVVGELPTTGFAMLRLLLAIAHRGVDGPRDRSDWAEIHRDPQECLAKAVSDYLAAHRDRFDLFCAEAPFFQVAGLHTGRGDVSRLEVLIADVPNNIRMFPTRYGPALASISPAEAARWVVHAQAFDPSGIRGAAVGDARAKDGKVFPIGTGWAGNIGGIFAEGATLRDTLLLNMVPVSKDDVPVWERTPQGPGEEVPGGRAPTGPVDAYTWQKARIRLVTHGVGEALRVVGALIGNGDRAELANRHGIEPMTGWYRSANQEKARKSIPYYLPARHDPSRLFWRGIATLLPRPDVVRNGPEADERLSPGVLDWLAELERAELLAPDAVIRLHAVGMEYGPQSAVVNDVVDDTLSVRLALLRVDDQRLHDLAVQAVDLAGKACWALGILAANIAKAEVGDDPGDSGKARIERAKSDGERAGYSALDAPFRAWLAALGTGTDTAAAREHWTATVATKINRLAGRFAADAPPQAMVIRPPAHTMCVPAALNLFHRYLRDNNILARTEAA